MAPPSPERIWLQRPSGTLGHDWTWSDHEIDASDVEYMRVDLAPTLAPYKEAPSPHTGHWTGTEENQAIQLIAAMTSRTPEEVKEPLSILLHSLRYRVGEVFCESCERQPAEGEAFSLWGDGVYTCSECSRDFHPDPPGMVITDLSEWEGEDGG
jgi:hypothetical protein